MQGVEGKAHALVRDVGNLTSASKHNDHHINFGRECAVQNDEYDYGSAKTQKASSAGVPVVKAIKEIAQTEMEAGPSQS